LTNYPALKEAVKSSEVNNTQE